MAKRCRNYKHLLLLKNACLPLKSNYEESKYKIYFHDNGLLMASLDEESSEDLRGRDFPRACL